MSEQKRVKRLEGKAAIVTGAGRGMVGARRSSWPQRVPRFSSMTCTLKIVVGETKPRSPSG